MTIVGNDFEVDGKEEILDALVTGAEEAFGQELDPDSVTVLRAFYEPIADYLAMQQGDIADVLAATKIDDADGAQLDTIGALIGVIRRAADSATVRAQFSHNGPVSRDYTVPSGTEIQTDAVDSVSFETTEAAAIELIDDLEDNDLTQYVDTGGSFSTTSAQTYDTSNYALTAGGAGTLYDRDFTFRRDTVFHVRERLDSNAVAGIVMGVQDADNMYRAIVDDNNEQLRVEVYEGGSVVDSDATSVTVPASEWVELEVEWSHDGDIRLTLYDAQDTELGNLAYSENLATFETGGVGFYSGGTTTKYWDNFTTSAVGISAEAIETGSGGNVGAETLTVLADSVTGVDAVTNPTAAAGGRDQESDTSYRLRIQQELSEGTSATQPALVSALQRYEQTRDVSVIVNDAENDDAAGRPPHSFEAVVDVDADFYPETAEIILDTKAAGDIPVGGFAGSSVTETVELVNGQTKDIEFSIPSQIKIYVDCDLTKTSVYAGDDAVRDNIVEYLGGVLTNDETADGELEVSDDVIYNQILEAVMTTTGVRDVTNLEVDTTSSPTGTSNITIADTEVATADATDGSLDISSTDV